MPNYFFTQVENTPVANIQQELWRSWVIWSFTIPFILFILFKITNRLYNKLYSVTCPI